jgi:hypothetical protein
VVDFRPACLKVLDLGRVEEKDEGPRGKEEVRKK